MERKKLHENSEVEIEKYQDGTMGIILPKSLVERFDEAFKNRPINIFVALGQKDRKLIIEVTVPRQDYIA